MADHIVTEKRCSRCKAIKPLTAFWRKTRTNESARGARCAACMKEGVRLRDLAKLKPCAVCGLSKPRSEFFIVTRNPERAKTCRPCQQVARFWARVEKTEDCWEWTGACNASGYGSFDRATAHRFIWTLLNGPIPEGKCILHRCDNPPCVRPEHLFLGTKRENFDDMIAKRREGAEFRARQNESKLTAATVREARALFAAGAFTYVQLAARYEVAVPTIYQAVTGYTWKHVA